MIIYTKSVTQEKPVESMQPAKEVKLYPVEETTRRNRVEGFICLYRSVKKHWLWTESRVKTKFEAWVDLLLSANHDAYKEPIGYDLIELKRGQILTSQERLSQKWFWDRGSVRGFLKQLQVDNMIITHSTNKYTLITICNYGSYNDFKPTGQQQKMGGNGVKSKKTLRDNYSENEPFITGANHQSTSNSTSTQHIQPLEQLEYSSTPPVGKYTHNGFFDRQIANNQGSEGLDKYQKLVDFLHEKEDEGGFRFENVLKISKQISFRDYLALKVVESGSKRTLKAVLEKIENYNPKKPYKNLYLTAKHWLEHEFEK